MGIPQGLDLVWTCISAALIALLLHPDFRPTLGNDSFQYLSMVEHALKGHFADTSLAHFDAERSFGLIPAPMVAFPAGYPWSIALVSQLGLPIEAASLLISVLSIVACVPLLAWISHQIIVSRLLRNVVIGLFVFNAALINYATWSISEPLFTFFVLAGVALIVAACVHTSKGAGWRWFAVGLMFGAAY